ncbi:MAG: hypothetical protein SFU98_19470 [Leptospiraceae bacterium]|nr:hypothetical protein [Leptospiraceae bacterium]
MFKFLVLALVILFFVRIFYRLYQFLSTIKVVRMDENFRENLKEKDISNRVRIVEEDPK